MISPLLAQICKLGHITPDVFEAPCTVCVKPDAQHMKLPHLGTEVSVCRECCILKHQVFSMDSKWMGRIGVKGHTLNICPRCKNVTYQTPWDDKRTKCGFCGLKYVS